MTWWIPAAAGFLGSIFGGGTKATTSQRQLQEQSLQGTSRTSVGLRQWNPQEQAFANLAHHGLAGPGGLFGALQGGAAGRGDDIASGLYGSMSRDIRGATQQAIGQHRFQAGLGGMGPSSLVNRGVNQILQGQGRALTDARAQSAATGAQIGTQQFGADLAALQGMLGGYSNLMRDRMVGASQTQRTHQYGRGTTTGTATQPTNWLGDVMGLLGYGWANRSPGSPSTPSDTRFLGII